MKGSGSRQPACLRPLDGESSTCRRLRRVQRAACQEASYLPHFFPSDNSFTFVLSSSACCATLEPPADCRCVGVLILSALAAGAPPVLGIHCTPKRVCFAPALQRQTRAARNKNYVKSQSLLCVLAGSSDTSYQCSWRLCRRWRHNIRSSAL